MKLGTALYFSAVILAAFLAPGEASALGRKLAPRDFNKMYYLASHGKVGFLRDAVNRGLDIDSVNLNGDTGLCIAVKRNDYVAYNSFRMSGANPRHACTYRILEEYKEFLASNRAANTQKIVGNEESLYYDGEEKSWWPWILGGAVVGGVALALGSGGGGGSDYVSTDDPTIVPTNPGYGLGSVIVNSNKEITTGGETNNIARQIVNSNASDYIDKIQLLPNVLSNSDYLLSYVSVSDGAFFDNLEGGSLHLYDATVGANVTGEGSAGYNHGAIQIEAENGAIGLVASNDAEVVNGRAPVEGGEQDSSSGRIDITFKGNSEGDTVIGMYGDTNSTVINYGQIKGTSTQASASADDESNNGSSLVEENPDGEDSEEDSTETVTQNNSGTMLGMVLFDLYTGTDLSANTVTADNYGTIDFSAGYNSATDVAVSLIGMGSYIDDNFLNGNSDPSFAEKMKLNNYGDINLSYQGSFNLADTALKLGQGGLIGIRADAATEALNQGNINIDLSGATMNAETDVAAGMLSVHGGALTNDSSGVIRVINEATSGGVSYGMLAAKGEGSQTRVYDWKDPVLLNHGLIDMQASNAYGMASFAGGDVINYGVINLGVENGQSYYTGNYGLYAAGEDLTEEVLLQNKGVINVYSEESVAIYNAFSGSVEMVNDGTIYLSNKATDSQVFGGNFSSAYNNGSILYKVGNSSDFSIPSGNKSDAGYNVSASVRAAAVTVSGNDNTTKQLFVNNGEMTIGDQYGKTVDYGGTYGTAAVQVSKQGAADNNGTITLEMFDVDYSQFNVGMWLDSSATAESYANNYGDIVIEATNSIGIRNDSGSGGTATNFGSIYVNGQYGYGMAVTSEQGAIFNGRTSGPADSENMIYVSGKGSVGMYAKNGKAYNYGSIYLQGDNTTGIMLDGDTASLEVSGNIYHNSEYDGITYYWATNGASYTLDYPGGVNVENYTLGKATSGGIISFSGQSTAYVMGEDSYLLYGSGSGTEISNEGTVYASVGASPIVAYDGAAASNSGEINVSGESTGMYASGSGSNLENLNGGNIIVNGGTGLDIANIATGSNYGNIEVQNGTGMAVFGQTLSGNSMAYNYGTINVSGAGSVGVSVTEGGEFSNAGSGRIIVSCPDCEGSEYAIGISSNTNQSVDNSNIISVSENSIGMSGSDNMTNSGMINLSADSAIGMVGGTNSNEISGSLGTGMYGGTNSGTIDIQSGTGMHGGLNAGEIMIDSGTGMEGGENQNNITVSNGTGMLGGTNSGTITIGNGNGGEATSTSGIFTNSGTISVGHGNGIQVFSGGTAVNTATGEITLSGSGYGVKIEDGGVFSNYGTINYNSDMGGNCSNGSVGGNCVDSAAAATTSANDELIYVGENGTFLNGGVVEADGEVLDFDAMRDETGTFAIASGGTYKADAFKGSVVAGSDIVKGGFEDVYVNENSFEGRDDGLSITSGSYMFDASLNNKGDNIDVEMNRKGFDELVDNKEIADFLETNYKLQNNEALYDALKDAADKETFDETTKIETGQNFYANLPRENMAVLRGLNTQEQNRILEDGLDGGYIGADYFRTGKDGYDGLSGYSDNVYSPYIGYGAKLGKGWSIGATLRGAYADAEYDEASSSRDNKILMAFMPVLYKNNSFQFLTMPSVGAGYGTYKRRALSGTHEADTLDLYYGLYNHAEYSIDMKVAELVAEAELNLQGSSMSEAEEDGGLNLQSNDSVSLEAGVGLKLRKRIQLAKNRSLMLALGAKYYHEFLDPYKDLRVGMDGSPLDFGIRAYDEDKNRLKTTAEAVYKDGDFAVAAEVSHNAERESSIEGGVGVRYNF